MKNPGCLLQPGFSSLTSGNYPTKSCRVPQRACGEADPTNKRAGLGKTVPGGPKCAKVPSQGRPVSFPGRPLNMSDNRARRPLPVCRSPPNPTYCCTRHIPAEGNLAVIDAEQAVIGNGHAMRVAAEVIQDLFGAPEGRLGVNHPLGVAKRCQVLGERFRVPESLERREELQLAGVEGGLEMLEEQAPEQSREHADGEEEARAAGDPMFPIGRDPAARNDAMEMGMEEQVRSPAVEHGQEADFSA